MQPFDSYPSQGRQPLGRIGGDNARRGYGLKLHRLTGITSCAYCGISLVDDYYHWLLLSVDHVIPKGVAENLDIPLSLSEDAINLVLSCSGCNTFANRYQYTLPQASPTIWTVEAFVALRDLIFVERSAIIGRRREDEQAFFEANWKVNEAPFRA